MSEQQMQFRVGLLAIVAFCLAAVMAVKFGDLATLLEDRYPLAVHFDHAPGVYPGTPVSKNGIVIGEVAAVIFDDQHGGVLVALSIEPQYRLRKDAAPHLSRSLLGDSSIEFVPGSGPGWIEPGARLEGVSPVDPMKLVADLGGRLDRTLAGFDATAAQWSEVGRNVNGVLGDNREELNIALARAAVALEETALSMRSLRQTADSASKLMGDPALQQNLNRTMAALPPLVEETRQTIVATRSAVNRADATLANVEGFTRPLAEKGVSVATRLDVTLANFEQVSGDLADLSTMLKKKDGSLAQLASDPSLYRNLDASAENLNLLLANLGPVLRDLRVFSDKIARNPELIGVRGALRGSDGEKTVR
ncbi:MlaD family protein [Alienimonas californiensis]|uniref:Mce related protein n=1 Tax=Alienimonas californiensis TaxID=2527989 RepID=A0A517PD93_9PLAN|nr:MlaD family protein [Alienimonas californiensis]QDT17339.1 mce related protein [Alienimonas californiensis]